MEYVKVITLRSGTELQSSKQVVNTQLRIRRMIKKKEDKEKISDVAEKQVENEVEGMNKEKKKEVKPYEPPVLFP